MEYSQDRMKSRINDLELEIKLQQEVINTYKEMDKDRAFVEIALIVVGLLIGIAIGFYGTKIF